MTITINYETKSDQSRFINISMLTTTKKTNSLKINLDKSAESDWNREKINTFLVNIVAENDSSEIIVEITDQANQNRQQVKEIEFIVQLFETFAKQYNEMIKK
ncbi:hypothetical protein DA803_02220 [[Mycoplasma] phocae]|uniref:Uncharacterized protein n=1 Tax=[Mycoplasma] phocae TaxID=142651 RepID=A0A2Z5IQR1_9BACT|nr:hypothetical protein [[Mycoplasma] phocae]AXE60897.1 hypothetical protein DA803_02220 [[Mycoplasma] phocae]